MSEPEAPDTAQDPEHTGRPSAKEILASVPSPHEAAAWLRSHRPPRIPFPAIVITILAAGIVGLLVLNVSIQSQAFALKSAKAKDQALMLQESDLRAQVYAKSAPGALASAASGLGMAPNPYPNFVDLRSGKVIGNKPVTGSELPGLGAPVVVPTKSPAAAAPAPATTTAPAPTTTTGPVTTPAPAPTR